MQLMSREMNRFVLASLELNLTFHCNLACEYCFVHNRSPEDRMDFVTAAKAIDLLLTQGYPNVTITLIGGEPLLEFELIQKIVPYALENAQKRNIAVEWAVTTNGTLINEAMLAFFSKYRINLLLSLDGGPETHDRYRKTKNGEGTWQQIVALIPLLRQYQGWLGARMTVSIEAVDSMRQDFRQLVDLGINQFIIAPAQGARLWSQEEIRRYSLGLAAIQQDYYALKEAGASLYIEEFETVIKPDGSWGCQAGATSLAVAPNGDVSPCSKLLGLTSKKGQCIIGNVHSGIDYGLLAPFQISKSRHLPQCSQCSHPCNGGCYAVNYEQTGDHFTPSEENCRFWAVHQEIARWVKIAAKDDDCSSYSNSVV
ncbi:radical SAM/SPASM domain-containing protein [Acetonema longum]|uniref:radical SAM/SPASM domain-containing protein n=1 Tax=Acetonema longum TaxID=2374 RepID=UPI001EE68134|nr:radical SAM protein [Acetonema longum]